MQDLLRDRLGFDGVIVTDSLGMGAIVERYGYDRVAVEAFLAGSDALLMPADFDAAYQGMLAAVESGEISQERLDASVYRIVLMKLANERR
jgi:beta-N-acetylhexosaminidase